jgi:two-component system, NarL family, sensor kinase
MNILYVSLAFLLFAFFVIIFFLIYRLRLNRHLKEKAFLNERFQKELLQSQIETQEQTFQHLSREIHDNVGQILSLAKVQLNIMEEGKTFNQPLLTDVKESVGKAMIDLRDIAKSLNTDRIKLCSLAEMTNHELQRIARLGTIKTFFTAQGQEQPIDEQKKLIVFRMIQEALQNILKHAGAQTIEVAFKYDSKEFNCEIKDDGKGFDPTLINSKEGLGLQNLVSRAALIGGQSNIQTGISKGTIITIVLPYE